MNSFVACAYICINIYICILYILDQVGRGFGEEKCALNEDNKRSNEYPDYGGKDDSDKEEGRNKTTKQKRTKKMGASAG